MITQKKAKLSPIALVAGVLLALAQATLSVAQSRADLAQQYAAASAYIIRPGIVMFVDFDKSGQACTMTIQAMKIPQSHQDYADTLSDKLADEIANELAPASLRGRPLSPYPSDARSKLLGPYLGGDSYVTGGSFLLKEDFENLSIEKLGTTDSSASGGIKILHIKVLQILWANRQCPNESVRPRVAHPSNTK